MHKTYLTVLLLVGLINFLPLIGALSMDKINQAYGLNLVDKNLEILLRHRALLFGMIGGLVIYSVFVPKYQDVAIVLAGLSMLGFILLCYLVGDTNHAMMRIFRADIVGVGLLLLAVSLKLKMGHG